MLKKLIIIGLVFFSVSQADYCPSNYSAEQCQQKIKCKSNGFVWNVADRYCSRNVNVGEIAIYGGVTFINLNVNQVSDLEHLEINIISSNSFDTIPLDTTYTDSSHLDSSYSPSLQMDLETYYNIFGDGLSNNDYPLVRGVLHGREGLHEIESEASSPYLYENRFLSSDFDLVKGSIVNGTENYPGFFGVSSDGRIQYIYENTQGDWVQEQTAWGYAIPGSLYSDGIVIRGLDQNRELFSLWGDAPNISYSNQPAMKCKVGANIVTKSAYDAFRGSYCVNDNDRLMREFWTSDGWVLEELTWAKLLPTIQLVNGEIFGTTTNNRPVVIWNDNGNIRTVPLSGMPSIVAGSIHGTNDGYARGIFALEQGTGKLVNIFWEQNWKFEVLNELPDQPNMNQVWENVFGVNDDKFYFKQGEVIIEMQFIPGAGWSRTSKTYIVGDKPVY